MKNHHGYYVTAVIEAGTGNQRTSWLCGPFTGARGHVAALKMVGPVKRAIDQHSSDPRFAFAAFGTAKITSPIDKPLSAGVMPLEWLDGFDVINASGKRKSV